MPDKLFTQAILVSVNIKIPETSIFKFLCSLMGISLYPILRHFSASLSRNLHLQQISVIKKWTSIWAGMGSSICQPRFAYEALGGMVSYICPETAIPLQNQCYLKANINKLLLPMLHVLLYFPVWHHNRLISSHVTTLISYCLTIWLTHPRLIPVLSFQGSLCLLMEVPSTVQFGSQQNFNFTM